MNATTRTGDVVVVGAGIVGLSIAHHLLERGLRVQLVDRTGIGAGASGVQPGGVRRQWATRSNCLAAQESYEFYCDLPARLGRGEQPRFTPCGYAFVAHSNGRLAELAAAVSLQQSLGIPSVLLGADEAKLAVPQLDVSRILGAAWCAEDGYFDRAHEPVEAFADAVLGRGAGLTVAAADRLRADGDGWRVVLDDADALTADHVVVAAAHDSKALLAPLGFEAQIAAEPRHLFYSRPLEDRVLDPLVIASELGVAAKQLADGRLLASDLRATGDRTAAVEGWLETVRTGLASLLPGLAEIPYPDLVSGTYDVTPDHDPLLGPVPGAPGVWIAAGFSGHGFMLAPAVGRLVADAVTGAGDDALLGTFKPGRFAGAIRGPAETQVI